MAFDDLGDRMKNNYENRTRFYLPRRTYTMFRVDGKAFHSYTRGCQRPYDTDLMDAMDQTAKALCEGIQGARIAFVQSDEITVLTTDFDDKQTEAWFDGNLQKMCSLSAAMATAAFIRERLLQYSNINDMQYCLSKLKQPIFDSRVWTIPDRSEVANGFIWRQQDAIRNSISMAAQAQFSHKQLDGKSCNEMQEMLWQQKGINWSEYPDGFKNGRCVIKQTTKKDITFTHKKTKKEETIKGVERKEWVVIPAPVFTQNRDWLMQFIPGLDTNK